jgi:hypothetical protein
VGGSLAARSTGATACQGRPNVLYIPLQFWFNRNPGLALPLIALQDHEVRFNITLAGDDQPWSPDAYSSINAARRRSPCAPRYGALSGLCLPGRGRAPSSPEECARVSH